MNNFARLILFLFVGLFSVTVGAQIEISGTIIDSETGKPVPFAYVKKKKINRGAITNEDGYFELVCSEFDTLIISFVSYERVELPFNYFIKNEQLLLNPSDNELATVEIYADFDFLYDLLHVARRKLKQAETYPTKTYFALETATGGIPVELLECYYNGEIGPSGINELSLKNGRIGMSEQDGTYFASLNTTEILSDYRLLNKRDNRFPINPLQLSKGRLKKCYDLKLMAFEDGVYKIDFLPKKQGQSYFASTIWIDKHSEQIVQMDLAQSVLQKHPFMVIDEQHKMDSLNFNVSYTFSNDTQQSLDKIAFSYDLKYNNGNQIRQMNSNGVFLFFEKNAEFELPYYSEMSHKLSDYDKIVAQPYNERFWQQNEVISPSRKSVLYQQYFKRAGVLLNFEELSKYNELFKNRIVEWGEGRVILSQINEMGNYNLERSNDVHKLKMTGTYYDFKAHIYLDRNEEGDSVYYLSKTLVDLEDSYYFFEQNKYTDCIINLYFDMVEIERRDMMKVLNQESWTKAEVDSIYQNRQVTLNLSLRNMLKEVSHGEDPHEIKKYVELVELNLDIDNSLLIWSDVMVSKFNNGDFKIKEPWIGYYNHGTALLELGKYEEALPILLKAYDLGSRDPWLLYNLGLNYLKLDKIEKGCSFLTLAKEMGEEVSQELTSECD